MKIKKVIKRNGNIVDFNIDNITNAVYRAFKAAGEKDIELARKVSDKTLKMLEEENKDTFEVEYIQDIVEKALIKEDCAEVAKAYILYRKDHADKRNITNVLIKKFEEITFSSSIESDMKRENANIDSNTAMGSMLKFGSESAKEFYKSRLMNPKFVEAHEKAKFHIHDMDFYSFTTTCCQIDLEKLFKNGFSTGHGFLREPNSIQSYAALACIALQSNQNEQHKRVA